MRLKAILFGLAIAIGIMGCTSMMKSAGYTRTADIPPPPPPPRNYAEEIKNPGNFANYQNRGAEAPGLLRVNLQSCKLVEGPNDQVAHYDCQVPVVKE